MSVVICSVLYAVSVFTLNGAPVSHWTVPNSFSHSSNPRASRTENYFTFEDGCCLGCYAVMMEAGRTSERSVNFYQSYTARLEHPKSKEFHISQTPNQLLSRNQSLKVQPGRLRVLRAGKSRTAEKRERILNKKCFGMWIGFDRPIIGWIR